MGHVQKPKKTHKSKLLTSGWMLDIKRWFAKWNMENIFREAKEITWKEVYKKFKASLWERLDLGAKHRKFKYYYYHIQQYTPCICKSSSPPTAAHWFPCKIENT